MYRVTLNWAIEWIDDEEPGEVIDAEVIRQSSGEDPELADRLSDIAYYDALAASLES